MTVKRAAGCSMFGLLGIVLAVYLLCPKPPLYGDIGFSTALKARNDGLLRLGLADDQRYRLQVALDDVAPSAVNATLLYEDQYFYSHPGVNPAALMRAAWSTYVRGHRVMGGSTITMQLARLRFALGTRTFAGKLVQIARALQLERHYTKRELLEAYLNLAPYGGNVEGMGTAALVYFDKPAAKLSVPEALALAVIPQNPARRNPATARGYVAMDAARQRLGARWHDAFGLSEAGQAQLTLPLAVRAPSGLPFVAQHFSTTLLADHAGAPGVVSTTLRLPRQRMLADHIASHTERNRALGIDNASALLIDHRSMEVLASVGSADFFSAGIFGQVDGTRAKRSPGSTLKPFVYGLAIDQGLIHPMTLLHDAPRRFAAYTPENFDRGFMGPVVAQDALIYSRNVPAIELLSRVGIHRFHEFLSTGGVTDLNTAQHYGLAAVLGGLELSMEELVQLYAMLANGGVLQELVKLQHASPAGPASPPRQGVRLMSREASFLVLDMLSRNPRPDGLALQHYNDRPPVAWKTGTSYAFRDAWSVGVIGPYVLAVWVGNFDGSSNPAFVGREAAAPLFFAIADTLAQSVDESGFELHPTPDLNLRKVAVCASTGDLPGKHCPRTTESWFVPGVSPIKVSNVHRAVQVDNATGKRSCTRDPGTTHAEVFEFWPTDIAQLFRQAGVAVRRPPPWAAECSLDDLAATGMAPVISSLSQILTYQVRAERMDRERVPLTATADADARWLYWFVDDRFIGKSAANEPLLWAPTVGSHDVLAVDDLGRSDGVTLSVAMVQ